MTSIARALTYVEIDIDYCANTYGIAPCTAAIGVTGNDKCFNSLVSCQDRANFINDPVTIRFAVDASYLPKNIPAIPSIMDVSFSPATISLGKDLGIRATLNVSFRDHPHSDTGDGYDKYYDERDYDPFTQGTFWGKFRARQPYLKGRLIRLIRGFLGQALADMDTRHYIIEGFNGPTPSGIYSLTAKDVLKLADGDRAQAPVVSNGFLVSGISAVATALTLSPAGIANEEYPASGYVAIGGSEIVAFTRAEVDVDVNTIWLLHADGGDGTTTFTDASAVGRAGNDVGSVQIDTAQFKFGTSSILFDGVNDAVSTPDAADLDFTGDFTIDCWIRLNATGTIQTIFNHSNNNLTDLYSFHVTAAGALAFSITAASVITFSVTGTALLTAPGVWHHVAVTRSGSTWRLFVDGALDASTTSSVIIANHTGLGRIGLDGGSTNDFNGWIDEFRISNVARWTVAFTAPVAAFGNTDILNITRGQLGTTAVEHEAQDRVQLCLQYIGETPAFIIEDLFVNYAGIPSAYIPTTDWDNEVQAFLQRLYTATIAEPTDVKKLVSEVVEQAALAIWWDDRVQQINLKVLRAISVDAFTFDEDDTLDQTLQVEEQPDLRASQIWTYYGQRNPLRPIDEPDNFRSTLATVNLQAETDEGQAAIMKIFSRWIPAFGRDTAERLNDIQLGRFQVPPRRVQLEVFRGSVDDPVLGGGYRVEGWSIQDAFGAPSSIPIQITRLNATSEKFTIEAEEMTFETLDPTDLTDRTIIIDSDINDVNLRSIHDGIFPEPVAFESPGITITCIVEAGVIVGASTAAIPAFDVGDWPAGVIINIVVNGRLQGAGGAGGKHGPSASISDGEDGGTALYTREAINLTSVDGRIYGGGGGGGRGIRMGAGTTVGGGGGAGRVPGPGGLANEPGDPGTLDAGGQGEGAINGGGDGGDPGEDGEDGFGFVKGLAGYSIDGLSFVTQIGAIGDRLGPTVN